MLSGLLERRMVNREVGRRGLKVLLVDDNDAFVEALVSYLEELPWTGPVEVARSAEEAIVFAAHYRPDLILMDYEMPGTTGLQALRAIKSRPDAPPVLIMSMHEPAFLEDQARQGGADGFLPKDEMFNDLPRLLEQLFGGPPPAP
jgi:CheY-like chemotaxis protein